jgi:hypothetical protein
MTTGRRPNGIIDDLYVHCSLDVIRWSNTFDYKGMLDMPAELSLMLCTYMDHQDLRALATSSHFLCSLLLPEYLRRRGLVLKDTSVRGASVALHNLGGYASLGLWSVVRIFYPPEDMYRSIPFNVHEARSAMRLLVRFLQEPSNTCNLRSFHIFLPGSDPYLLMAELLPDSALVSRPAAQRAIHLRVLLRELPLPPCLPTKWMVCHLSHPHVIHHLLRPCLRSRAGANHNGYSQALPYQESRDLYGGIKSVSVVDTAWGVHYDVSRGIRC